MQNTKLYKSKQNSVHKNDPAKITKNLKYEHIKTKLNTGPTLRDVELLTESRAAKLRQEIFGRISAKRMNSRLIKNVQNESIYLPSMEIRTPSLKYM